MNAHPASVFAAEQWQLGAGQIMFPMAFPGFQLLAATLWAMIKKSLPSSHEEGHNSALLPAKLTAELKHRQVQAAWRLGSVFYTYIECQI